MQEKSKNERSRRKLALASEYKDMFSSPIGKKILYDIMSNSFVLESSFCSDPYEMAYREGARSVVLRIMQILKYDIRAMEKAISEADDQARKGEIL